MNKRSSALRAAVSAVTAATLVVTSHVSAGAMEVDGWVDTPIADIGYADDEYPAPDGGWFYWNWDVVGDFGIVPDSTEPLRGDGSLRLETTDEGDEILIQRLVDPYGAASGPALDQFSGSYEVSARSGAPVAYTLQIACPATEDRAAAGALIEFAGPFADEPGWQTLDVDQDGDALWSVAHPLGSLEAGTHRLQEYVDACPGGRIHTYGVRLDTVPAESHVDAVVFGEHRTNFLIPPLRRIAADPPRMIACEVFGEQFYRPDPSGQMPAEPPAVVVANEARYQDAILGGALANAVGGPLLLNPTRLLDPRYGGSCLRAPDGAKVYLMGDTRALSREVAAHYRRAGHEVVRVTAPTTPALSVAVARIIGRHRPDAQRETLLLATGSRYQEALVASAAAGARTGALLLTRGPRMPKAVARYLSHHRRSEVIAVGPAAVTAAKRIRRATSIAGATAYATSVKVGRRLFPDATSLVLTTGERFPEALTAGSLGGHVQGPVLLVRRDGIPAVVRSELADRRSRATGSVLLGTEGTVSRATFERLYRVLRPR